MAYGQAEGLARSLASVPVTSLHVNGLFSLVVKEESKEV